MKATRHIGLGLNGLGVNPVLLRDKVDEFHRWAGSPSDFFVYEVYRNP